MNPTFDFSGQVALVTGASSGVGLATAQAHAESGAAVVLTDVNETALRAATEELAGEGHQVLAVVDDVSDEAQVASVVAEVVAAYGRLDAAFNNADIMMPPLKTADTDSATFDRIVAVNLAGVWNCVKHKILQMRTQRYGTIVNNSSIAGLKIKSGSGRSAYTATKHAVLALTKSAALEEGAQGIRVNAVCPVPSALPWWSGWSLPESSTLTPPQRPPPSRGLDEPRTSPRPCCGCAARAPPTSPASPCRSTEAWPPADGSALHNLTPGHRNEEEHR